MKINGPALRFGCFLMASAALAAYPACGQTAPPALNAAATAAPASAIARVEVGRAGQQTTVLVTGTGTLHYQVSRLDNPARLVLDFADTRLAVSAYRVTSQYVPVRGVRMGEPKPGQSRVVIDLEKFVPYSVQANGTTLTVSFTAPAVAAGSSELRPISYVSHRRTSSVSVPEMPLPAWLTGDLSFARLAQQPAAPPPAAAQVQVPATQQPVAAATQPASPAPSLPMQTQAAPATRAAAQEQAAASNKPSQPKYTGDPISVNLKDVDLKDFFRLIHEISGLNVVLDPSVHGSVTLVLDEVPWDQALDIVLSNNGLAKELNGNVLRIASEDTLKREAEQRRDLAKAQSEAVDTVTETKTLSYAKATALTGTIKRFLSSRGDVIADDRTNTLIISDIPSSLPRVENLLRQLDKKAQQVEIDARVVQTSRTFARELGTQLAYSFAAGNNVVGGNQAVGTSQISRLFTPGVSTSPALIVGAPTPPPATGVATAVPVQMPLATNLAATTATSGLTYLFTSKNFALDYMLSAMESRGVGKILSEPKGITQNNEKLTVKQGQQIPIQTNINNTITTQYVDAVLKLEVTPQITAEGTIFLNIDIENTQIDNSISVAGQPGLDTQSTETKVLINDGGTVVVGGVVINNQTTTVDQVPLLGSMPLIGNLFKHTIINVSTQELMFFVTPQILPG